MNIEIYNILESLKKKYAIEELKTLISEGYKAFTPTGNIIKSIESTDDMPIEYVICCMEATN